MRSTKSEGAPSSSPSLLERLQSQPPKIFAAVKENLVRDWLNHVAGFFRALALVQSDVLLLQSFMLTSSSFTIFRLGKDAQYTAVGYAFLFASLSGFATFKIARDRFVWLTEEEEAIYAAHFNDDEDAGKNMTKPLFKKLMSIARRAECDADFTVLERGKTSGLALLVDGTATISSSTWSTSMLGNTEEAMQYRLRSFPTTAHAPVEIVRGRGFYGEVSFVHGLTSGRNDAARADVSFSAGSRYIFWDGEELRALLKKNPALSNALIACVSMTISRKLYDTTTSVDSTSRDLQTARTELDEEVYRRDAISVALHALVEQKDCEEPGSGAKLFAYLEDLRAKRASRLGPVAAAGTATCDHDARAHRRHAISGETHERMLKELRLKLSDDERILGPDAPSLIDLCSRLVERVRPEAKIDRRVNLLKGGGSRHPSFVVRQGSVHYGDGPG